jgi:hypothetical protein
MRVVCVSVMICVGLLTSRALGAGLGSGVDIGTKTSGIGTGQAPQPSPQPSIDARPDALPSGSGVADTPGKTGLGYPHDGARQDPGTIPGAPGVPPNAKPPATNPVR